MRWWGIPYYFTFFDRQVNIKNSKNFQRNWRIKVISYDFLCCASKLLAKEEPVHDTRHRRIIPHHCVVKVKRWNTILRSIMTFFATSQLNWHNLHHSIAVWFYANSFHGSSKFSKFKSKFQTVMEYIINCPQLFSLRHSLRFKVS